MSRWICIDDICIPSDENDWEELVAFADAIAEQEPIDIVRCKECRYCKKKRGTFKGEPIIFYRCTENNRDVESDDFCSYGEREGE